METSGLEVHKKMISGPGGDGGELNACHRIYLKMPNNTSAGGGHAKSTASLRKLAVSQI